MIESVVQIQNLTKIYDNGFRALSDVTLEIVRGEVFGLLGPNGAGKTTLINIVAGLTRKSSGSVLVYGRDVERDYRFTRSKIGLVQQEVSFDPFFSIQETLEQQAGYFGVRSPGLRLEQILKNLHLWDKRDALGRILSGGMKRRVMIAKALVHDPDILFLDEPTAGVDVELRENLWQLVREMQSRGKTIILTTHYLEEAQQLANRIGIISGGIIATVEDTSELLKRHNGSHLQEVYLKILNQVRAA